jgi:hemerythrin
MTLLWRKQLSLGNESIDTDHKYLICLINTVELALRTQQNRDILLTTLEQLAEYTRIHFEREEGIMLSMRYPRYDQHKQQHQLLIRELESIRKKLEAKVGDEFSPEDCDGFATLFRHWLLDHLVKEDMLMKPLLTGSGGH